MAATNKTYFGRIYTPTVSGTGQGTLIATVKDFVFSGFQWDINSGLGECILRFPRKINNFGEGVDISLFNQFDIYVNDRESPATGELIYSGYIVEYSPNLSGHDEYIDVTLWGYASEFAVKVLETGGSTTMAYSQVDTGQMIVDLFKFYDGKILPPVSSYSSYFVSYTFKQNTMAEAISQVITMSPPYYFWRVGADNQLVYSQRNTSQVDHYFVIGKDVLSVAISRSAKQLRNGLYFLGGNNLYTKSKRDSSQTNYGTRLDRQQDLRVTEQATAAYITSTYLNLYDHPVIVATVDIIDSNGDNGGYDIEKIKPGQVIKIVDPTYNPKVTLFDQARFDVDVFDYPINSAMFIPFQVMSVKYMLDKVTLSLAFDTPDAAKRIQDIIYNQVGWQTATTPASPTVI